MLWAAAGGLLASIVIGVPMTMMGAIEDMVAGLVGSDSLAVGWAIHLVAGIVFAAPFGWLVARGSLPAMVGLGLLYGFAVGVLFAWLAVWLVLGLPLVVGEPAMVTDIALHTLWGGIVGGVAWLGYARAAGGERERRRVGRPV